MIFIFLSFNILIYLPLRFCHHGMNFFYILRIFCAEYMKLLICKTIPGKNIVKIFSNRFCASPLSFPTDLLRSSSKAEALKIHHLLRPGSFVFFLRKKEIKLDIGVFSLILLLQYWHNEIILSI